MLMSFLGTIVLGLGVAGTWMLLVKALRIPAPRWTVPALGGLAMLVFHVYIEYSWFQRTAATLPARAVVADTGTYRHPLQPWTLLVPQINRFTVLDAGRIRTHADQPKVVWAEVAFVTRYYPTMRSQHACTPGSTTETGLGRTLRCGIGAPGRTRSPCIRPTEPRSSCCTWTTASSPQPRTPTGVQDSVTGMEVYARCRLA